MKLVGQLILTLLLSNTAHAEMDCYAGDLVVNRQEVLHFSEPSHLQVMLPNSKDRDYFTNAAFHWLSGPNRNPVVYFDHVLPPPATVGIPYSIYKVRLELGTPGTENFWSAETDFSQNCTQAGRAIYPGENFQLPVKFPQREGEFLRIKIWGRHI